LGKPVPLRRRILFRFLPMYAVIALAFVLYLLWGGATLRQWFSSTIEERTSQSVMRLLDSYARTIGILQSQYQMVAHTVLDGLQRVFVADTSATDIPKMELDFFVRRMERRLLPEARWDGEGDRFLYSFTLDAQGKLRSSSLPEGLPPVPPLGGEHLFNALSGEVTVLPLFWSPERKNFYEYGYWIFPDRTVLGVAVAVDQELLHQVERMIGELQELPFVAEVHLYSFFTGSPIWESGASLDEAFLARVQKELPENGVLHLREQGARRGVLYSLWRSPGESGGVPLEDDAVLVEIRMDFSFLVDVLYRGVGWGMMILLLGTAWMFWSVARTSLEIVHPFHVLMQGLDEFMTEPTSFALSEPLDEDTPLEVQELTRSFQNMGREIAAGMEELKAMNEELEELYMSREKLAGRLEHVISLAVSLSAARNMGQERYMNRILALAVDMLPGASTGIVGILEGEEVRILSGVGVDVKLLEGFPLKPEHVVFRGATVSFALMMDRWPEDLRRSFSQACPEISQGLMVNLRAGGRVLGFLAVARSDDENERFSSDTGRILDALGSLASGFLGMQQLFAVRSRFQEDLLRSIISILEMYDAYTSGHSENVARISRRVAQAMGLTPEQVEQTYWAGFVHDVGKLLVPTEVLNKIEPLTPEERAIIQTHPSKGREVLSHSSELGEIAAVVEHHHERWDGRGYPAGLVGREIPLLSRILSVADAYDAMTSDRAYRKGVSSNDARQELRKHAGTQFDPQVVEAFLALGDEELASLEEEESNRSWRGGSLWSEGEEARKCLGEGCA